jgi:iron complex outermembrane receptor protein
LTEGIVVTSRREKWYSCRSYAGILAVAAFAAVSSAASGWAQSPAGVISGIVTSSDGARLPHARVTVIEQGSGRQVRGASDHLGAFVFDRLVPGIYSVVVEFPGFASHVVDGIRIDHRSAPPLTVSLDPMGASELVTVSGALPRDSVEVTTVRESPARDVGELLADSTGIWKVRKGGIASDVVVRGMASRDLNVLIDGERLYGACPNVMDPPASHVDFSQVERVDVGKGPFDVRYQGGLGGIVNVVTRRPEPGWHASTSLGIGAYGFINPSTTASYGGARGSILGGFSYRRSDPYTDGRGASITSAAGYRDTAVDSEAFRARTAWARAGWTPVAGHRLDLSVTRQQTDHTLYPYLLMDAIFDDADRVSLEYAASALGADISGLKLQAYWSRVEHWMTDAYRTSSGAAPRGYSMATDASTLTVGGRAEMVLHGTTIGGEFFRRNWNAETLMAGMMYMPQYSIPDVDIDSAGVFVEHARALTPRVAVDVGGRLDFVSTGADSSRANLSLYSAYHATTETSRSDVVPSGRVKLTFQVSPVVDVSTAVGHSARVADGTERFFGLRRMGTDWVGNPSLSPARNTGVDVSVALKPARVTLTANAFANVLHDYIAIYSAARRAMVPGVMNTRARSYANVDARQWGLEANGSVALRTSIAVSGDVAYVRGRLTPRPELGILATELVETPPLRARLRTRFDDGRLFAEIEGVANAAQTRVDPALGESPTPSSAVANLTAGVRHSAWTVTVGVANVFDTYYVEHLSYQRDPYRSGVRVAEPGRNLFANLSWKF